MDYDVIIVGGGPAGLTAAIYCVRRKLRTVVVERMALGGQMRTAYEICNWPGVKSASGQELSDMMGEHAKSLGVEFIFDEAVSLKMKGKVKELHLSDRKITSTAVILATGGHHRRLNAKGEKEYMGRGVSYCATCDGPFFKGKVVAVVGGGNSAADDALYLSTVASKVYLIHRRDSFRCEARRVDEMKAAGVEFILESHVKEFLGDGVLEELVVETNRGLRKVKVDGCFISVGVDPANSLAKEIGVELDGNGFVEIDPDMKTNVDGVFAAGDVTGGVMQIPTAVGEGCTAALKAYEYVKENRLE
ncbi:MAG: FAD-dependent oxidoreductase [Candidatus Altiarchaeota archaeon]